LLNPCCLCRYRHEFKSNELWLEIKLVLDTFAAPLTELFKVSGGAGGLKEHDELQLNNVCWCGLVSCVYSPDDLNVLCPLTVTGHH